VARRWGERKSKPNMNYDKLSRALRWVLQLLNQWRQPHYLHVSLPPLLSDDDQVIIADLVITYGNVYSYYI
jgi:hypothetical protein